MRSRVIERELKLKVGPRFELPDLTELATAVRLPPLDLRATYFDTPDLRLFRRAITLRFRRNGSSGTGEWTVKLPRRSAGSTLDRDEINWPHSDASIPGAVSELLRGVVRGASLGEVAELRTIRHRLVLRDPTGATLGELEDDTVTVRGGDRDGFSFRQIEFELDLGDQALADAVRRRLLEAGARVDDQGSKLARALDLPSGGLDPETTVVLSRRSSLGDVVRASIAGAFDRILDHEYRLRLDGLEPPSDAVHETRVATRRLRSDLTTLGSVLDSLWLAHTRAELKWIASLLGAVRDADVLADQLDIGHIRPVDTGGVTELRTALADQRRVASRELTDALSSERYLTLLDHLHAGAIMPPFSQGAPERPSHPRWLRPTDPAKKALPQLVQRPWRKLGEAVAATGPHPSDVELHRIRIRAKQLRYGAELTTPVVGEPAREMASKAEQLQTVLGEHQDAVVAEQWLRRQALSGTLEVSFSAGQLASEQRRRQRKLRRRWRRAWDGIDESKPRDWRS